MIRLWDTRHVCDIALSRSRHGTVGADLSAKAVFQPLPMRRVYRLFRGQTDRRPVRPHERSVCRASRRDMTLAIKKI